MITLDPFAVDVMMTMLFQCYFYSSTFYAYSNYISHRVRTSFSAHSIFDRLSLALIIWFLFFIFSHYLLLYRQHNNEQKISFSLSSAHRYLLRFVNFRTRRQLKVNWKYVRKKLAIVSMRFVKFERVSIFPPSSSLVWVRQHNNWETERNLTNLMLCRTSYIYRKGSWK